MLPYLPIRWTVSLLGTSATECSISFLFFFFPSIFAHHYFCEFFDRYYFHSLCVLLPIKLNNSIVYTKVNWKIFNWSKYFLSIAFECFSFYRILPEKNVSFSDKLIPIYVEHHCGLFCCFFFRIAWM